MSDLLLGAVEAGGTKFICAIADRDGKIIDQTRFATTQPQATLDQMQDYFSQIQKQYGLINAFGIASFGPIELDPHSPRFGYIVETPKTGWANTDLRGALKNNLDVPIGFDTDVNAAALAELQWGAGRGLDHLVYITIGTGIGGGVIVHGKPVHGLLHAELGHLRPQRHRQDIDFAGVCPFHHDCFEGLASGPAIQARWGCSLDQLDSTHLAWVIQADYLGQLCAQIVLHSSPQRIVLGGGVMQQKSLFPMIRQRMKHWLGGYIQRRQLIEAVDDYIVAPELGDQVGIRGALLLAQRAMFDLDK